MASSMSGGVHGRGSDLTIINDPIKPLEALSEVRRRHVNKLYDRAIYPRLNHKTEGAIVLVMQRLHEDDLVGHVLAKEDWEVLYIPAIETEDREYRLGSHRRGVYVRRAGEVLHAEREPREALDVLRRTLGLPELLGAVSAKSAAPSSSANGCAITTCRPRCST